ncbi:MAG: MBL fold metallo-hydrolase [Candidatus Dormibacteraeota bacterium]|nr:MBL fold metallo-hydrolase [Candidatus Dormibacteraeota bacterium]
MTNFLCVTCGSQFTETERPPERCPICDEERQYIGLRGQRWTTVSDLASDHDNVFRTLEPGLVGVGTVPSFAIGQRALLIRTPNGNVLWDCISLLDETTVDLINGLGGVRAIAISHPHYYSSMVEWARAFGAPVHLHAADRQWVMRQDGALAFWDGETLDLGDGLTLIRTGGHFEGGTVLHWPGGAGGRGALLSGDLLQVVPDRRWVSFMYSYPNLIPLPATAVRRIADAVAPFAFERIYGAWWRLVVQEDGKGCVERSVARYLAAIGADQAASAPPPRA